MSYWGRDGRFGAGMQNPSSYVSPGRPPQEFSGPTGADFNYLLRPGKSWRPDRLTTSRKPDMTALLRSLAGRGEGEGEGDFSWRKWFEGEMPGEYSEDLDASELSIDPMAKVHAARPVIDRELDRNMANVGMRLGMGGGLTGGGYATELGQEASAATDKIGSLIADTVHETAREQADREQQSIQNRLDRLFGGWGQYGDWKMRAGENEQGMGERRDDRWNQQLPYIMELIAMMQGQGYTANPQAYAGLFG